MKKQKSDFEKWLGEDKNYESILNCLNLPVLIMEKISKAGFNVLSDREFIEMIAKFSMERGPYGMDIDNEREVAKKFLAEFKKRWKE